MTINIPNEKIQILLIDDEKSFRDSLKLFLEDDGFNISEAENGRIGIEKIVNL
ncbi:MAG: hypothetical protein HQL46_15025 [Gammaproteobacteria bacterium]|nr:hypothetical protein [Gammaproteobacteria bacterium]